MDVEDGDDRAYLDGRGPPAGRAQKTDSCQVTHHHDPKYDVGRWRSGWGTPNGQWTLIIATVVIELLDWDGVVGIGMGRKYYVLFLRTRIQVIICRYLYYASTTYFLFMAPRRSCDECGCIAYPWRGGKPVVPYWLLSYYNNHLDRFFHVFPSRLTRT